MTKRAHPTRYALTADLVESRKVEERPLLAKRIQALLEAIVEETRADWYAPLVPSKGMDELTGVLRTPAPVFRIVRRFNQEMGSHPFRFALGAGTLDVDRPGAPATTMDGPAFHRAAAAMERARRDELPLALELPGQDPAASGLAEAAALVHQQLVESWTEARARLFHLYRKLGNQEAVARRLKIAQQSVSEGLRKAHYKELFAAEKALDTWFASIS